MLTKYCFSVSSFRASNPGISPPRSTLLPSSFLAHPVDGGRPVIADTRTVLAADAAAEEEDRGSNDMRELDEEDFVRGVESAEEVEVKEPGWDGVCASCSSHAANRGDSGSSQEGSIDDPILSDGLKLEDVEQ